MMKNKFVYSKRRSLDRENIVNGGSVSGDKHNRCVVYPGEATMVADALEMDDPNWTVRSKVANDLIVQIGDSVFQLHQLPMVSKSGYLNRLAFQRGSTMRKIEIDDFPGGPDIFLLVVKFCYGWKIDLTAANVAPAYCAAHFLEMTDDLQQGNLISKTETFLNYLFIVSWKDIFQIFKSCETISPWAKELDIVKRCSEAVAWKACLEPRSFDDSEKPKSRNVAENWWFEDVSRLRIDHFLEVIELIKKKGTKSELVGSCIACWTSKWLSQIPLGLQNLPKHLTHKFLAVSTESLIKVLPEEKNSVSCNFLLRLFKFGILMKISSKLLDKLEKQIAALLENCSASDLLVKNYGNSDTVYDVKIVTRVVKLYILYVLNNPASRIFLVGRLVDEYLIMVARDDKLSIEQFLMISEALPKDARYCNDSLYRAIDMYLKAHPMLTEEERTTICRAMNYHKLSETARQHAMKNDRLPSCITTRLILLEQSNMTKSVANSGSNFRKTNTQAVIRLFKGLENVCNTPRKEIKLMKEEVEKMKVQVNALKMCRMQLQKQVKGHSFCGRI